jgi:hypothetical protein
MLSAKPRWSRPLPRRRRFSRTERDSAAPAHAPHDGGGLALGRRRGPWARFRRAPLPRCSLPCRRRRSPGPLTGARASLRQNDPRSPDARRHCSRAARARHARLTDVRSRCGRVEGARIANIRGRGGRIRGAGVADVGGRGARIHREPLTARAIRDAEDEDSRHGQRRPPNPNHRLPAQLVFPATSGGPARSETARLLRFLRATHGDIFAKS